MPELHDLMDDVRGDLTAVRLPPGDELRRRVRHRRQRAVAAVALATVVTAGAAAVAWPDRDPAPPPTISPTVSAEPVEIPRSALLRPEDVDAGPDTADEGADAFAPIRLDIMLELCVQQRSPALLAVSPRYSLSQSLLLGTEIDRPAQPFVLKQRAYRLSGPQAAAFLRDLRAATLACDGFTQTGVIERPDGTVEVRAEHRWSIVASGFAGDDSILVRHAGITRNAATGRVVEQMSEEFSAYLRVGDLVTVLIPRAGTTPDDLRRSATTAAQRLCGTADPPC
ncbi:hypothetical protein [Asanoa iriomotensis]|uniref:PknH-like protein n=1 Tax=Asanoa iriomotensis TaxID=234613 RepID=A0ABQ4CGB9_9ACTN|nr:hypothetical protein [Asanoa iriomotensis]GIF61511.1 hypothetical protein Air01nite_76060 [Asanoa iriomotensis]